MVSTKKSNPRDPSLQPVTGDVWGLAIFTKDFDIAYLKNERNSHDVEPRRAGDLPFFFFWAGCTVYRQGNLLHHPCVCCLLGTLCEQISSKLLGEFLSRAVDVDRRTLMFVKIGTMKVSTCTICILVTIAHVKISTLMLSPAWISGAFSQTLNASSQVRTACLYVMIFHILFIRSRSLSVHKFRSFCRNTACGGVRAN